MFKRSDNSSNGNGFELRFKDELARGEVPSVEIVRGKTREQLTFWRVLGYLERLECLPNELFMRALWYQDMAGSVTYLISPPYSTMYFTLLHGGNGGLTAGAAAFESALAGYYRGLTFAPCGWVTNRDKFIYSPEALKPAFYAPTCGIEVDPQLAEVGRGERGTSVLLLPPEHRCPACGSHAEADFDGKLRCGQCDLPAVSTGWRALVFMFLADLSGEATPARQGLQPMVLPINIYAMPDLPQAPMKSVNVDRRLTMLLEELSTRGLNCAMTVTWRPAPVDTLAHKLAKLNARETAVQYSEEGRRMSTQHFQALMGTFGENTWAEDPAAQQQAQYAAVQAQRYVKADQDGKFDSNVVLTLVTADPTRKGAVARAEAAVGMVGIAASHLGAGQVEVIERPDLFVDPLLRREAVSIAGSKEWFLPSELSVLVHVPKFPQPAQIERYVIPDFELSPSNIGQFNQGPEIGAALKDGAVVRTPQGLLPVKLDVFRSLVRMIFITGLPGAGKSNTATNLLHQLIDIWSCKVLVFDRHNEYKRLVKICKEPILVINPLDPKLHFRLNPLQPTEGVEFEWHYRSLCELLPLAFGYVSPGLKVETGPIMYFITELALRKAYQRYGYDFERMERSPAIEQQLVSSGRKLHPTIQDLYDIVVEWYTGGVEQLVNELIKRRGGKASGRESMRIKESLGSVLARLTPLQVGIASRILNPPDGCSTISIGELLKHNVVFELGDFKDFEANFLNMILLYEEYAHRRRNLINVERGELPHITVVEEAHNIATRMYEVKTSAEAMTIIDKMLIEFRKYGEGMITIDQSPANVSEQVIRMSNTIVAHRLQDPKDIDTIAAALMLDRRGGEYLAYLPIGIAICKLENSKGPVPIQVPKVEYLASDVGLDEVMGPLKDIFPRYGAPEPTEEKPPAGELPVEAAEIRPEPTRVEKPPVKTVAERSPDSQADHAAAERALTDRHADVLGIIASLSEQHKPPTRGAITNEVLKRWKNIGMVEVNTEVSRILRELGSDELDRLVRESKLELDGKSETIYELTGTGRVTAKLRLPLVYTYNYLKPKHRVFDVQRVDFAFEAGGKRAGLVLVETVKDYRLVRRLASLSKGDELDFTIALLGESEAQEAVRAQLEADLRGEGANFEKLRILTLEQIKEAF